MRNPSKISPLTILPEQIESSACTVRHVRGDTSLKIFKQKYECLIGTKIESVQRFFQLDPNVHLNSAALSQENQSFVREHIPNICSKCFLPRLKSIS